jgi:hypothetical protein
MHEVENCMQSKTSKYEPLKLWLQRQTLQQVDMTFDEISDLVGGLPLSASKQAAWWANETDPLHVQCKAWLEAGYTVQANRGARKVRFSKAYEGYTRD